MTFRKVLVRCCVSALMLFAFIFYWFNWHYYPAFNLYGVGKSDYEKALVVVAKGYAKSVKQRFLKLDSMRYKETSFDDSSYAWASVAMSSPDTHGKSLPSHQHVWIFLAKKGRDSPWLRRDLSLLANPEEDALYSGSRFFGLDVIALHIRLGIQEQIRRVSEVLHN